MYRNIAFECVLQVMYIIQNLGELLILIVYMYMVVEYINLYLCIYYLAFIKLYLFGEYGKIFPNYYFMLNLIVQDYVIKLILGEMKHHCDKMPNLDNSKSTNRSLVNVQSIISIYINQHFPFHYVATRITVVYMCINQPFLVFHWLCLWSKQSSINQWECFLLRLMCQLV